MALAHTNATLQSMWLEDIFREKKIAALAMCSDVWMADQQIIKSWHLFLAQIKKDAIAISLIKGMRVRPEGPQLISAMVQRLLRIDCSVLMGANIATDIGETVTQTYLNSHCWILVLEGHPVCPGCLGRFMQMDCTELP